MEAADEVGPSYDRLLPTSELATQAIALSLALDHPVYDCLYLATAELEAAVLITADARFKDKLSDTRHASRVALLGEWP
jgi:predicted nucleic acid-binding protein